MKIYALTYSTLVHQHAVEFRNFGMIFCLAIPYVWPYVLPVNSLYIVFIDVGFKKCLESPDGQYIIALDTKVFFYAGSFLLFVFLVLNLFSLHNKEIHHCFVLLQKQMSLWSRHGFIYLSSWKESCIEDFILFTTSSVEVDESNNR